MKKVLLTGLCLAALAAAGTAGYWAGNRDLALPLPAFLAHRGDDHAPAPAPAPAATPLYYHHPDDETLYSEGPARTEDGRDYVAVYDETDMAAAGAHDHGAHDHGAPVAQEAREGRRILYYRNPMGLPDISPVPRQDSMGMDYIPVYEGEETGDTVVTVATGRLQQTGVRTAAAERREIVREIRAPARIEVDERRVSIMATRSESFIDHVEDVTTGDVVAQGQVLLHLYSPDVAVAGAQFLTELAGAGARPVRGGARQRLANLGVADDVVAEIEESGRVPLSLAWSSPRDGVVLERSVTEGMRMGAGETLFRIADISALWVLAEVPEYQIGDVEPGAAATVRLRNLPGRTFQGSVARIYPQVAAETRTTTVRIELDNPDGVLRPGAYAEVEIESGGGAPVVAVPDTAVIDTGTRQIAIIDLGEGRFEPREVTVGRRGGGWTEIREGIAADERIVVSANFLIDAESNLRAALSGLVAGEENR